MPDGMNSKISSKIDISEKLKELPTEARLRAIQRLKIMSLRAKKGRFAHLLLLLAILGPGILVMIADNDAGGVITYAQTGSIFGIGFFIPFLILMIPVTFLIQEMAVRLAAVTHRGHAEMIWLRFGKFWGSFSLIDLVLANTLTMVTEFIGIVFGMEIFGISQLYAVIIGLIIVLSITLFLRYYKWERVSLLIASFNIIFIPIMFFAHPNFYTIAQSFVNWHINGGITPLFIYVLLANIGTTIAPWMLFFQQSSEVDKGTTVSDLKYAKRDTLIGAVIMSLVAISIMVFTASLVFNGNSIITSNDSSVYSISYILQSVSSKIGMLPVKLFALGIIDAGIIAAIVLVASTSWAFSEALGWPKSINLPFLQAKKFYLPGITCVAIAALIVLIPNLPLGFVNITVQVIASIVMPAALLFLLLLVNDKEVMGKHVNSKIHNIVIIMIIIALICMSMAYSISIILPKFF